MELHVINVSCGWHPWHTCVPWMSSIGYMYPMDVIHGISFHVIPCVHGHLGVKLGSVFWTSQEPSGGRCWVSIWGPRGVPGSVRPQFCGQCLDVPGIIRGPSREFPGAHGRLFCVKVLGKTRGHLNILHKISSTRHLICVTDRKYVNLTRKKYRYFAPGNLRQNKCAFDI